MMCRRLQKMENDNNPYKTKEVGFKSITQKNQQGYNPEKTSAFIQGQRKGAKLDTLGNNVSKKDEKQYDACRDE